MSMTETQFFCSLRPFQTYLEWSYPLQLCLLSPFTNIQPPTVKLRPIGPYRGIRKIMCALALIMTTTARPDTNLVTFHAFFAYPPFLQCFSGVQA